MSENSGTTTLAALAASGYSDQIKKDLEQKLSQERFFLEPRSGRCVIKRDGFRYSGALIIPDRAKQLPTTGTVLAVGNMEEKDLVGKRVVFARFSGTMLTFKNKPHYDVLAYEEILCIVNKTDEELELDIDEMTSMTRDL